MTECCADLDEFFDGELPVDQADAFRDHLPTCERCERVLHGRMQERVITRVLAARPASVAPGLVVPGSAAPAATPAIAPGKRARAWSLGRAVAYAAPLLAAAAAIPLWLAHRSESGFELSLAIDPAPVTARGVEGAVPRRGRFAHTGDVLRPIVHGERQQAIWVYLDERELVLRCPEDARCHSADSELTLELTLTARGTYAIVAVGSSEAIPPPGPTLDDSLAAARTAGVHSQVQYVNVD